VVWSQTTVGSSHRIARQFVWMRNLSFYGFGAPQRKRAEQSEFVCCFSSGWIECLDLDDDESEVGRSIHPELATSIHDTNNGLELSPFRLPQF
jgi:hypothetical protein